MAPPPAVFKYLCAVWFVSMVPRTFTANRWSQSAALTSLAEFPAWIAAGCANASSPPIKSTAAPNAACTRSVSATSTGRKVTVPEPSAAEQTSFPAVSEMSMPTTWAPALTYALTVAAPIPLAQPVTIIRFSIRSMVSVYTGSGPVSHQSLAPPRIRSFLEGRGHLGRQVRKAMWRIGVYG